MSPGSPKKKQLSPLRGSRSYWFDLPDIAPRKKKYRHRLPMLLIAGLVGTVVLLLILASVRGSS